MNSKELRGLMESYSEVYESETARGPRLIDAYDKPPYSDDKDSAKNPIKLKRRVSKMKGVIKKEELDIFDVVLEFLQAEGYAETLEEAEWMMANELDAEDITNIFEAMCDDEEDEKEMKKGKKSKKEDEDEDDDDED